MKIKSKENWTAVVLRGNNFAYIIKVSVRGNGNTKIGWYIEMSKFMQFNGCKRGRIYGKRLCNKCAKLLQPNYVQNSSSQMLSFTCNSPNTDYKAWMDPLSTLFTTAWSFTRQWRWSNPNRPNSSCRVNVICMHREKFQFKRNQHDAILFVTKKVVYATAAIYFLFRMSNDYHGGVRLLAWWLLSNKV